MRPGEIPTAIYDRAAEEIATHLLAGRDVGVLCEGDPFFYGSFSYLHERLTPRFPCTILPGVTSLTACAAASGRPLTRRDDVLTVLPATLPDGEIERRLRRCNAAAILKVGRHFSRMKNLLDRSGLAASATYVAHATRDDEAVAPLAELDAVDAPYFSMILLTGLR
jgi:precorrin-2/cobalt-factor-2 C20-methyltransferase